MSTTANLSLGPWLSRPPAYGRRQASEIEIRVRRPTSSDVPESQFPMPGVYRKQAGGTARDLVRGWRWLTLILEPIILSTHPPRVLNPDEVSSKYVILTGKLKGELQRMSINITPLHDRVILRRIEEGEQVR